MAAGEQDILQQLRSPAWKRAAAWIAKAAAAVVPANILEGLRIAVRLAGRLEELRGRHEALYKRLQVAMGILPSSERGRASKGKAPGEPRKSRTKPLNRIQRLCQQLTEAIRLADWHKMHFNKQKRKAKESQKRLDELQSAAAIAEPVEEEPLSEAEQQALRAEQLACHARAELGTGADPALGQPTEVLMQGGFAQVGEQDVSCDLQPDQMPRRGVVKRSFSDVRQRIDFCLTVQKLNIDVKKYVVEKDGQTTVVSGDVTEYGPAKMKVTWRFLAHSALLVTQFAMPLHRLAKLLSTEQKRFTSAEMARHYQFIGEHFAPIYLHLAQQLAQAPVLSGDDSPSLVVSVARALEEKTDGPQKRPWDGFATAEKAKQTLQNDKDAGLPATLARELGFASMRKDGKGDKVGFNTSLLCGRAVDDEPQSTIFFYRSHLGSLGNLLDALLVHRAPEKRSLVVQTDLSTTNLVCNPWVQNNFEITLAGCSSHARRPFALWEQQDPESCAAILHDFKGIAIYENLIDAHGRNPHNTLAVRGADERECWQRIRENCEAMHEKWSRATPLGAGARYVLRHYHKLTYYLDDVRLSPSNNQSERMLRQEKLIRKSSLFRASLEGRCALDILRTITQTAIAAEVNVVAYLIWVMQMPRDAVAREPESFTPRAFGRWWDEQTANDEDRKTLDEVVQAVTQTSSSSARAG